MAVQNAKAPRRKHQQPRARKQDSHQVDGEQPLIAEKPGAMASISHGVATIPNITSTEVVRNKNTKVASAGSEASW